jgi:hypothetical protein
MHVRSGRRLLATCAATILVLFGTVAAANAAPAACDGVWVVVQTAQEDASTATASCASEYGTGVAALKSAGHTPESKGSMLTRIDGLPKDADFNSNGGYYWSYWSATVSADGTLGAWTYYQVGPDVSKPKPGTAEGWLLTNDQKATGPALHSVGGATSTPTASPSATATPASSGAATGSPLGVIVAVVVVVVAVLGLGGWWLLRRGSAR